MAVYTKQGAVKLSKMLMKSTHCHSRLPQQTSAIELLTSFTVIRITVILLLYAHCKRPCGPYVANKCMYVLSNETAFPVVYKGENGQQTNTSMAGLWPVRGLYGLLLSELQQDLIYVYDHRPTATICKTVWSMLADCCLSRLSVCDGVLRPNG